MSYSAIILGLCQFLYMAVVAIGLSFNALVGKALAPSPLMATLPFLFMMGSTAMLTLWMPKLFAQLGYSRVFLLGSCAGLMAGLVAAVAVWLHNFNLFCVAAFCMGLYQASALYYRFAAADAVDGPQKSSAIAWVLSGGILAALLGPMIGSNSLHLFSVDYLGAYVASALLALVALPLLLLIPIAPRQALLPTQKFQLKDINRTALIAIFFCTSGYAMMTMVMLASPLAMTGCGYHATDAASVIQWHLLGMFLPSLLTGKLIARFGAQKIALIGAGILISGCVLALAGQALMFFHVALLVVGVGWNFMYMGGSTLLTQIPDATQRSRLQAINEFITFISATIVAGLTGWLFELVGWHSILYIAMTLLLAVMGYLCLSWFFEKNITQKKSY